MNEPTRGIDVGARADIYRIMREFCAQGYALVMTSSDLEEVIGIGDIVITMYRGRQVGRYARGDVTMHRDRVRHHPSDRPRARMSTHGRSATPAATCSDAIGLLHLPLARASASCWRSGSPPCWR